MASINQKSLEYICDAIVMTRGLYGEDVETLTKI